jgi:hypothetical protein
MKGKEKEDLRTLEQKKKALEVALHAAELDMTDLEEVAGGMTGCDSCSSACSPGCQPGHVNPD